MHKTKKKEFAQTMVEFAIVFPVLLVITYGIIEFGRMLFIYTATTSAAREAARFGATALNYKNCSGIRTAAYESAFLISPGDLTVGINYSDPAITCVGSYSGADLRLGDRITVKVTTRYTPIIPLLGISGANIKRQSTRTVLLDLAIDEH